VGGLKVRITGKEEMIRAIEGKHSEILEASKKGLRRAAVEIENEAKDYCSPQSTPYWKAPFDTGRLRGSIDGDQTPETEDGVVHTSVEVKGTDYDVFVHEGTWKMPARPFLLDAMNAKREDTLKTVAGAIREVLE
jgi:HK97 gp10 family phage protein